MLRPGNSPDITPNRDYVGYIEDCRVFRIHEHNINIDYYLVSLNKNQGNVQILNRGNVATNSCSGVGQMRSHIILDTFQSNIHLAITLYFSIKYEEMHIKLKM